MPKNNPKKREYHSIEYWEDVLREFREVSDDVNAKDFCKSKKIAYQSFLNWKRKIEDGASSQNRRGVWHSRREGHFDAEGVRQYIETRTFQQIDQVMRKLSLADVEKVIKAAGLAKVAIILSSEEQLLKDKESTDQQLEEVTKLKLLNNLK